MKFFNDLWENFVIYQYIRLGLKHGDEVSYSYMGSAVGFDRTEAKFLKWEQRYIALGYTPISVNIWEIAGGFGKDFKHNLYRTLIECPNCENEKGLLRRDVYRENITLDTKITVECFGFECYKCDYCHQQSFDAKDINHNRKLKNDFKEYHRSKRKKKRV